MRQVSIEQAAVDGSRQRAKGVKGAALSQGSYYRTVNQGRQNVRQSIITLLLGIWIGIVEVEDVKKLLELAGRSADDLSDDEWLNLVRLLAALLDQMIR